MHICCHEFGSQVRVAVYEFKIEVAESLIVLDTLLAGYIHLFVYHYGFLDLVGHVDSEPGD